MTADVTLTPQGTISVLFDEFTPDVELVRQIPGRMPGFTHNPHLGRRPRWFIPGTREALSHLRAVLPEVRVDAAVDEWIAERGDWLDRVEAARAGSIDLWPAEALELRPLPGADVGRALPHQVQGHATVSTLLERSPGAGLWHDMGLGKTTTALALLATMRPKLALVLCPASVIGVWEKEAREHARFPLRVIPLVGSEVKRAAQVMQLEVDPFDGVTLLVTNYDVIWRKHLLKALLDAPIELTIADEAHRLKNPGSQTSKAAVKIAAKGKRLALTGTPIDALWDWYGVYRWLDPSVLGTSFVAFRARYFDLIQVPGRAGHFPMITGVKDGMQAELDRQVGSLAHACSKDDALDLPDKIDVLREVDLEPAARRIYDMLRREAIALLDDEDDGVVVGQHVLTRLLRLSQVAGGYVKDDDGNLRIVSKAKLNLLRDVVTDVLDVEPKVVIFARFTAEIDAIAAMLKGRGMSIYGTPIIDGRTPIGAARDDAVAKFQQDPDCRAIIVHPKAGGAGITLHAASTAIGYSWGDSLIDYLQARDRIHRIGQTRRCTYVNLAASRTIDVTRLEALGQKRDVARASVHQVREWLS